MLFQNKYGNFYHENLGDRLTGLLDKPSNQVTILAYVYHNVLWSYINRINRQVYSLKRECDQLIFSPYLHRRF